MFSLPSVWNAASPHCYGCRHCPAGRVRRGCCSSPRLLVNIINYRFPSLSLHRCCLLPVALKPWTCGGLRLPPIDGRGEREQGEREMEWGECSFPHEDRAKKSALMTTTSRVRGAYNHTGMFKNTEGFHGNQQNKIWPL